MIAYLIKSTLCMALLWGFYRLVLQKENMFVFNRFYLLGSLLVSYTVPKLSFTSSKAYKPLQLDIPFEVDPQVIVQENAQWNYTPILWSIYILITSVFLFKYGKGLWLMIKLITKNKRINATPASLVLVNEHILPQTFFKYILINKTSYVHQDIDQCIIDHEMAHAKQLHSIDVLIIELLKVLFWFNPMVYVYNHSIRTNHEFLADAFALKKEPQVKRYQELLLNTFTSKQLYNRFSSTANYNLTKNRFIMMRRKTPQRIAFLKSGGALTLLITAFFMFSNASYAQEGGANPNEVKEFAELILDNYDQEGNPVNLSKEEAKRLLVIYNKMDAEQQIIIKSLRLPIPENGITKLRDENTPPPPPLFPIGAKYYIDGKEVNVYEARMVLPSYKYYNIKFTKGKNGAQDEFRLTKKEK